MFTHGECHWPCQVTTKSYGHGVYMSSQFMILAHTPCRSTSTAMSLTPFHSTHSRRLNRNKQSHTFRSTTSSPFESRWSSFDNNTLSISSPY